MLGLALANQKRFNEAEPLLLSGHAGLKQRASTIPAQTRERRVRESVQRLILLYDAWNKPEEAAKWRKELEAAKAAAESPAKP
jgi:hypothetical protein